MLKSTLEKIKAKNMDVFTEIERLHSNHTSCEQDADKEKVRAEIFGMLTGLKLAGFITEDERRVLYYYTTA